MSEKFTYSIDDKWILVNGPCEMKIAVDYDDVWHSKVEREVKRLVKLLNKNWKTE